MARGLKEAAIEEADVVDLAVDGRGIARNGGKTVFIEGALPGERVRFRVFKRRRQADEGGLVEVLDASADRVVPRCAHFGVCGGCSLQHLAPGAQLAAKQRQLLDALERVGRVRPEHVLAPLRGPDWAYRRRARLGVKYVHKKGRVLAGFRERDKPYIADLSRCEILVGRFAELPTELAGLVQSLSIAAQLPQVEVAAGDAAAALVFRVLKAPSPEDLLKLDDFGQRHGVHIYLQSAGLDSIRPLREGTAALAYAVDGGRVVLEFGPADFIQVNREVNRAMVDAALTWLRPSGSDRVLDLFCGLGNFSLPLAVRAGRVVGVEGDPALVTRARGNALHNGLNNVEFHVANLFAPAAFGTWAAGRFDAVLIDPPRAGAAEILEYMAHWLPRRVVYISCHPGSLARDAGILVAHQGFTLRCAGVMDMFPHTTHVESIAVFERNP